MRKDYEVWYNPKADVLKIFYREGKNLLVELETELEGFLLYKPILKKDPEWVKIGELY